MQDKIESVLHPRPLSESEKPTPRSLLLLPGSHHVHTLPVANPSEVNSAVIYYLHIGDQANRPLRAALSLFAQIASEPVFDTLRTKEQLGYITFGQSVQGPGSMGYRVMVQSERDPVYVESRIEAFLDGLKAYVEEMKDEEVDKHRQSLVDKKEEKPKNLGEETGQFWSRIMDRYYEFGRRE